MKPKNTILILPNIRSAQNVGAIFRTAEGAGINKIYLTGYTPVPIDKFKRNRKDIAKSALGAEKMISWKYKNNLRTLISKLKKEGYFIIAIEQDEDSIDYKKVKIQKLNKIAFLVGTEVSGLPKNVLRKCDIIVEIPMRGEKESLNVSVACGVALFRILNI